MASGHACVSSVRRQVERVLLCVARPLPCVRFERVVVVVVVRVVRTERC